MKKINAAVARRVFPPRKSVTQKWDYGHCLIIAGSRRLFGAAVLAARAALRGGAGLVTLAVPKSLQGAVYGQLLESLSLPLPETAEGTVRFEAFKIIEDYISDRGVTSVVIGPGLTRQADTARFIHAVSANLKLPMVLDADAINVKPPLPADVFRCLTPHRREFARLIGVSEARVIQDGFRLAQEFARRTPRAALVLKGFHSKVFYDGQVWENTSGNPGMAKGGSGDVLSGLMGAFLAQRRENFEQAVLAAVYLHGLAGDLAAQSLTQQAINAGDLLNFIPQAYKKSGIR